MFGLDTLALVLVCIYFVIPLLSTLYFALISGSQFSLQGFTSVFGDPDFWVLWYYHWNWLCLRPF